MKIKPAISVRKFVDLQDGDFFFFGLDAGKSCAAIRTTDSEQADSSNVILLGPDFPEGVDAPQPYWIGNTSVVSFGTNYIIRFPTKPNDWSITGRPPVGISMFIIDDDVYIGGSGGHGVWIANISAGEFLGKSQPGGPTAYTKNWEIGIEDGDAFQLITRGS